MIDFFEFSNEMLCLASHAGYLTRVNPAWTTTLGWTAEELTGRPYLEFVHPDDQAATQAAAGNLRAGKELVWFENRYRCRDGSYRDLAWRAKSDPVSNKIVCSARDITTLKAQTRALQESEARFRQLAHQAPIGIALTDAEGSIFFLNDRWCEMAGVTPEEGKGFAWRHLVHPEDLQASTEHWQKYLQLGQDMPPCEFRFLRGDGSFRWVSSSVSFQKDEAGQVVSQIATLVDITERRETEQRYRGIYEQSPIGIALIDSQTGRFLQINPKYEEIIGRTEAEMKQLTFQEITYPEDLEDDLAQMEQLRQGMLLRFQMEKRLFRGDGTVIWVFLTVVPMWRDGEPPSHHMALVQDITDRKLTADALRESEERFRAFMDHSPALAWAKDEEGKYVYLNRAYETRFGINLNDWQHKTDFDIWPADIAQAFWDNDRRVLASREALQALEDSRIDDQETCRWLINKFVFQDKSGRSFVGGVGIDVTELKQAEDTLRSNQALLRNLLDIQEQERQLLCHEFHDGLMQYAFGAVMSLSAFRDKHPGTESAEVMDRAIAALRKGIDDGRRAIRGIRPAVLDDFGLAAAIEDLVDQQADSGILVTSKCDPELNRLSSELQNTVYRVVQEALNNARKYSGTDVIRIKLQATEGELHLEVLDFGCGFDVEAARKRGFGLLGMTERVRLLGGECIIESNADTGTSIRAKIPIPRPETENPTAE